MGDKYNIQHKKFETNLKAAWKELYEEKNFCDVTFACTDGEIMAHKIILCSSSLLFKTILKQDNNQNSTIYLDRVQYRDLNDLVQYIYEGEINIAEDDLISFLDTARYLKIRGLSGENGNNISMDLKSSREKYTNEQVSTPKQKMICYEPVSPPTLVYKDEDEHIDLKSYSKQYSNEKISKSNQKVLTTPDNDTKMIHYKTVIPPTGIIKVSEDEERTGRRLQIALADESHEAKTDCEEELFENKLEKTEISLQINDKSQINHHQFPGNKLLTCNICPKQFTSNFSLKRHKTSTHEGIRYPCEECAYKAKDKWILKVHTNAIHTRVYLFCDQCDYSSTNPNALAVHKRSVHKCVRYPCDKCEYKAKRRYNLKKHRCIQEDDL